LDQSVRKVLKETKVIKELQDLRGQLVLKELREKWVIRVQ
jgi:hypothetical protein